MVRNATTEPSAEVEQRGQGTYCRGDRSGPGVCLCGGRHGLSPQQLFGWRRQAAAPDVGLGLASLPGGRSAGADASKSTIAGAFLNDRR